MKSYIYLLAACTLLSCKKNKSEDTPQLQNVNPIDFSTIDNDNHVMMQTFYWGVAPLGEWWNTITPKIADWKANGVDRLWLPVVTKGASGGYSIGYNPSDYFDFGEYNQHGSVKTCFDSHAELGNLISKAHENSLQVLADTVISHYNGGGEEVDPYKNNEKANTLFDKTHGNVSEKFNRNYKHFHPNVTETADEGGDLFLDLAHKVPHVQDWLWKKDESVAKYYKNTMKFDGWRFDYVKGFGVWIIRDWVKEVGGFAVGEPWDGNVETLRKWVDASDISASDFACYYVIEQALDSQKDMHKLMTSRNAMLHTLRPDKAVTFVGNHDVDRRSDVSPTNTIAQDKKLMACTYILTHSGYPCIFYSDHGNAEFKAKIQKLLLIRHSLAAGEEKFHLISNIEYVVSRLGKDKSPGLILFLNNSSAPAQRTITTHFKGKTLIDYTGNTTERFATDSNGKVTLKVPANSYTVWSVGQ